MVWNLEIGWLLIAFVVVIILSFVLALALNAIMGEDGFGATGNTGVITVGFFLAIFIANSLGYRLADLGLAAATGLAGAFILLFTLASFKAALNRL